MEARLRVQEILTAVEEYLSCTTVPGLPNYLTTLTMLSNKVYNIDQTLHNRFFKTKNI